jgi:hypothetical protein
MAVKGIILSPRLVQEDFVFYEVKIVQASSNRDITDDITIELTTSNNNKAKNPRYILFVK